MLFVYIRAPSFQPVTSPCSYLKGIADIDSAHYPERLGGVVIVNAPMALDFAWRVVQVYYIIQ